MRSASFTQSIKRDRTAVANYSASERFFGGPYDNLLLKIRWPVVFLGLMAAGTYFALQLRPPRGVDSLFPSQHVLDRFLKAMDANTGPFQSSSDSTTVTMDVVLGMEPPYLDQAAPVVGIHVIPARLCMRQASLTASSSPRQAGSALQFACAAMVPQQELRAPVCSFCMLHCICLVHIMQVPHAVQAPCRWLMAFCSRLVAAPCTAEGCEAAFASGQQLLVRRSSEESHRPAAGLTRSQRT
jgi:hypothetical protein